MTTILIGSKPSREAQAPTRRRSSGDWGKGCGCCFAEGGSLGSFARLKSPKVKELIRKKKSSEASNTVADAGRKVVADGLRRERNDDKVRDEETKKLPATVVKQPQDVEEAAAPEYVRAPAPRAASGLRGWVRAAPSERSNDDTLYPKHQRKMPVDSGFFSRKTFKELGCTGDMIESLRSLSFLRPSHIQALAYAPVLQGKSCVIADQSGSGKTLAYLIPIIQRLRQEELQGLGKSSSSSPRVVILVPTAELASQVLNNCRSISKHGVPFRSMVATGGFRQKTQLDSLKQELDVLIATPGRFIYLLQEGFVQLASLKCVVLDEVDILFGDEGFEQVLQSLISSAPMEAQYVFVTATLPVDIYNKLVQIFPDCGVTMGPGIHRTSSRLEEVLVDCSGEGMEKNPETAFINKKSALLQLAEESPVAKTIVFCNKIETCRKVENVLKRFDRSGLHIKVLPFHAALAQDVRRANMKEFLNSRSRDSMFLICTDRASRGIDFPNVDHVVLFDFPRDPSEYVRRVGRTARGAKGEGKALVFVVGKQVSLARRIMERNKKGHPLHDVPSAYELESSVL
ncbi:uncharacterized protein A4U43_C02F22800 [Asparagus officinalis]|uniref:DEAD-box ATP-dependent RNA helicase 50 n=1 Tax=Asparagus officinalis TaxID=4686 RepID=A0A5P1FM63_ASPOF|nr:uncharacterized protein A4U43_C02F22800 [Asparagus officinalis]